MRSLIRPFTITACLALFAACAGDADARCRLRAGCRPILHRRAACARLLPRLAPQKYTRLHMPRACPDCGR